jgi:quercetin dioxygenase-like cupin family protein
MTTSERASITWPWPSELDAMEAAPKHHTLLFENDAVRVLDAHVEPGETVPVHTHRWPSVLYLLSASEFVRRDPEGKVLLDTRGAVAHAAVGSVSWDPPLTPHSLENVGPAQMRSIMVEVKRVGE